MSRRLMPGELAGKRDERLAPFFGALSKAMIDVKETAPCRTNALMLTLS